MNISQKILLFNLLFLYGGCHATYQREETGIVKDNREKTILGKKRKYNLSRIKTPKKISKKYLASLIVGSVAVVLAAGVGGYHLSQGKEDNKKIKVNNNDKISSKTQENIRVNNNDQFVEKKQISINSTNTQKLNIQESTGGNLENSINSNNNTQEITTQGNNNTQGGITQNNNNITQGGITQSNNNIIQGGITQSNNNTQGGITQSNNNTQGGITQIINSNRQNKKKILPEKSKNIQQTNIATQSHNINIQDITTNNDNLEILENTVKQNNVNNSQNITQTNDSTQNSKNIQKITTNNDNLESLESTVKQNNVNNSQSITQSSTAQTIDSSSQGNKDVINKPDSKNPAITKESRKLKALIDKERSAQDLSPELAKLITLPLNSPELTTKTDFRNFQKNKPCYTKSHYSWNCLPSEYLTIAAKKKHACIAAFSWGQTIIQYPDGNLKKSKDCWVTPTDAGVLNYKEIGYKKGDQEIGHRHSKGFNKGTGVLPYAIDGLLAKTDQGQDLYILISQGMTVHLDVADTIEPKLKELQKEKKIKGYFILDSAKIAPLLLNIIRNGYRGVVFYHSTC